MKAFAVYGPPGTGKTTYLLNEVNKAVDGGYARNDIAFVSHTKAAASEALGRMGVKFSDKVATIHSIAFRALNLNRTQVVDYSKLKEFANEVGVPINAGNMDSDEGIELGDEFLAVHNLARSLMRPEDEVYIESHRPGDHALFKMFTESYRQWKKTYGYIDFTNMLEMYSESSITLGARVVFIDEAQDLSPLQWLCTDNIIDGAERIYTAGDDDQAIYVWGGADPHGMLAFEKEHNAERVILDKSYRIPRVVHEKAHAIVTTIKDRVEKVYLPKDEDGQLNIYSMPHHLEFDDTETLILYRNHAIRKGMEEELISRGLPYTSDAGRPGLFMSKWGKGIRAFQKLKNGNSISQPELNSITAIANKQYKELLRTRKFEEVTKKSWETVLSVPFYMIDYFRHVDILAEPNIRLSSIHAAKGGEADRVILNTGMTARTEEGMVKDPDAEARVWYVAVSRARHRLDIVYGENSYPLL